MLIHRLREPATRVVKSDGRPSGASTLFNESPNGQVAESGAGKLIAELSTTITHMGVARTTAYIGDIRSSDGVVVSTT